MELMDVYNKIENPISDPSVISKLVDLYSTSNGNFYNRLTRSAVKVHTMGEHYIKDENAFYSMLFNTWKKNILSMTRDRYEELRRRGTYDIDFVELRNYLKTVPDIIAREEIKKYMYDMAPESVSNAYYKYRFNSFGEMSGWVHIASRYVNARNTELDTVEHRLYLNTDSYDTYKVAKMLYEKLSARNIPIYFKFDEYGSRDDTIVIYSSTKHLINHLEVLEEIKKENPELASRLLPPPILTGKIDGWIGYGSEPVKGSNGKNRSFNEVRSEPIFNAIKTTMTNWIVEHQNMMIKYNGQAMLFRDYFSLQLLESFISDLEKPFEYKLLSTKESDLEKRKGYSRKDLNSEAFRNSVYKIIKNYIDQNISKLGEAKPLRMRVRDNKEITLTPRLIESTIQTISTKIVRNDPSVIDKIRTNITENSRECGIDNDKYCFDLLRRNEMIRFDRQREKERLIETRKLIVFTEENTDNKKK